jgi:hypothetical protein
MTEMSEAANRLNAGVLQTSAIRLAVMFLQTSANIAGAGANMAARIASAARAIAPVILELCALAALSYGCWLAWKPLGFIVPGAIVLTLSIYADVRSSGAVRAAGETKL